MTGLLRGQRAGTELLPHQVDKFLVGAELRADLLRVIIVIRERSVDLCERQMRVSRRNLIGGLSQQFVSDADFLHTDPCAGDMCLVLTRTRLAEFMYPVVTALIACPPVPLNVLYRAVLAADRFAPSAPRPPPRQPLEDVGPAGQRRLVGRVREAEVRVARAEDVPGDHQQVVPDALGHE